MDAIIMHYIIDLSSNNNFVQVPAVQGDGNETRYIEIELIENGVPYTVDTDECDITIIGTKPDGNEIWNTCDVTQEGYLLIEVTYQMTAVAGRGIYQVMIFSKGTNSQLKSFPFYMLVTEAAFDPERITSTDEFEVLTTCGAEVKIYSQRAEAAAELAVSSVSDIESYATTASTSATTATNAASSAATNATLAESWAVGGTGTRTNEDINNSKYWSEHAQAIVEAFEGEVDVSAKADKVSQATSGNFAGLDVNGNLTDSGSKASDFAAASHSHAWSEITDKPFTTLGTGLSVSSGTLSPDVKSVSVTTTGTASSTGTRKQTITINGTTYTINNSFYMSQSVTLSTSSTKTVTFTNSGITTSSRIDPYSSDYTVVPTNVVASNGSCTVTFGTVSSSKTITCGIEVKN